MTKQFILAQLSDTHIRAGQVADGFDPNAALCRALTEIQAYNPDAVIITGDLANDARPEEYEALTAILRETAHPPLYVVPGNHDDRALLKRHFSLGESSAAHLSYVVEAYPVRLVCVDQIRPGAVDGDCTLELAAWLDETLSKAPAKPTILAMHHPPFLTHDRLFDRIGLRNADRFAAIIAKHNQIIRILCGHHHRAVIGQIAHAPVVCAPSTAWGFSLAIQETQTLAQKRPQPGWALHSWREESGLASHIMLLEGNHSAG